MESVESSDAQEGRSGSSFLAFGSFRRDPASRRLTMESEHTEAGRNGRRPITGFAIAGHPG
jgi:hypothetical protein